MSQYILALDQGTTSSRAILFNHDGAILAQAQQEFTQIFPQPGWVEHDAMEIWNTQLAVAKQAAAGNAVAAIGITNQRETTVVWNRKTGTPVYNAIVWQDRRTAPVCNALKEQGHAAMIQEKTGLVIDAYFSATKIQWILDNVPGARAQAEAGELYCGTIDCWLLWKLTNGNVHATDVSNASRTMLLNIHTGQWDEELLQLFNVPAGMLPQVKSNSEIFGNTTSVNNASVAIAGMAGDQQSALFGQVCVRPGMVKNTYGTGCFMLMNTGTRAVPSQNKLLTTVAWKVNGITEYALEGSVFIAGAVVQWLRDGLGIIKNSKDVEALALSVPDNGGVYMVPAFTGLGTPYWNPDARGTIAGLTRGSTAGHIARAAVESIALQTSDVLKAMEADSGIAINQLRVDGGATVNNLLMQFQSDLLNTKVVRPTITETTALGAAYLAGLAVGYWKDMDEIAGQWKAERIFEPAQTNEWRAGLMDGWQRAVKAAMSF
jgi:glycerol kinase